MGENTGLESDSIRFPVRNTAPDEMLMASEFLKTSELAGGMIPSQEIEDPLFKGKNVVPSEVIPEYFVSSPDILAKEKSFPSFSSGAESMIKEQDIWSMDIQAGAGVSSCSNEVWENAANYGIPELAVSSELSDFWDLGSLHAAGSSGAEKWPDDECPFGDQVGQHRDDSSKKQDP